MQFEREPGNIYLCNPQSMQLILETQHMTGVVSGYYKDFADGFVTVVEQMTNASVKFIAYPGVGELTANSTRATGCFGLLQSGQVDLMTAPTDYPSIIGDNVTQGYILYDMRVGYLSSFPPLTYAPFQFIETFKSFGVFSWFVTLFVLLLMRLIILMKRKLIPNQSAQLLHFRRKQDDTYRVMVHLMNYGAIESKGCTMRVLFIVLTLFSFFTVMQYQNLIKTGLVVATPPKIFNTYEDLMRHGAKPVFLKAFSDYKNFKFAPETSGEKKFWNWAVKRFGEDKLTIEASASALIANSVRVGAHRIVVIAQEFILGWIRSTMCNVFTKSDQKLGAMVKFYNESYHDLEVEANGFRHQIYFRYPPGLPTKVMQILVSLSTPYARFLKKFAAHMLEHGHIAYGYKTAVESDLADELVPGAFGPSLLEKLSVKDECLQEKPVEDREIEDGSFAIDLNSLGSCVLMYTSLNMFSLFVLIYETCRRSVTNRKRKVMVIRIIDDKEHFPGKWVPVQRVVKSICVHHH